MDGALKYPGVQVFCSVLMICKQADDQMVAWLVSLRSEIIRYEK
jgi:hypothetical protein